MNKVKYLKTKEVNKRLEEDERIEMLFQVHNDLVNILKYIDECYDRLDCESRIQDLYRISRNVREMLNNVCDCKEKDDFIEDLLEKHILFNDDCDDWYWENVLKREL